MSSILKSIESITNPVTSIKKDINKEEKKIEGDVETFFDTIGEYALLGGIVLGLILVPISIFTAKQIPQAIESAAKIADIAKPI